MKKTRQGFVGILIVIILIVISGGLVYVFFATKTPTGLTTAKPVAEEVSGGSLSPEIEAVLTKKMTWIENSLANNPELVSEVMVSNQKDKQLSKEQIELLDDTWKKSRGDDDYSKQFLNNTTARLLKSFQGQNPGYPEIFVANAHGLNVGQTNKTSDYYQADEDWFVDAYNGGKGARSHGGIEFDQSAQSRSVSLYIPIYDANSVAIGVMKAVLDIVAIQQNL